MEDNQLRSEDTLTQLIRERKCNTWDELLDYVRRIPYGRNESRTDFSQVLINYRGTCSSKHALLKTIATNNKIEDVHLILGMYKMHSRNTPGIGSHIAEAGLEYIPEAHCYLKVDSNRLDLTNSSSDIKRISNDILEEIEIEPLQVGQFKVTYHKTFLQNWIMDNNIELSLEELWELREKCISSLAN